MNGEGRSCRPAVQLPRAMSQVGIKNLHLLFERVHTMSAILPMALVCRHQDKDDVGGGKGQRRSEPRGDVHYYRFVRLLLASPQSL